jgi:hypothetical protein
MSEGALSNSCFCSGRERCDVRNIGPICSNKHVKASKPSLMPKTIADLWMVKHAIVMVQIRTLLHRSTGRSVLLINVTHCDGGGRAP